jgi:hypothetical protein
MPHDNGPRVTPDAVVDLLRELSGPFWNSEREAIVQRWLRLARSRHLKTVPPPAVGPVGLNDLFDHSGPIGTAFRADLLEQIEAMPEPTVPQHPQDWVPEEEDETR